MLPISDAYFFDIDGTLLVTRDLVHYNALHQAMLEVFGADAYIDGIPYHGKTDLAILRAALGRCGVSDSTFVARTRDAIDVVCREVSLHSDEIVAEVCPGIPELLAELTASKPLMGIASGNLELVGWQKVASIGVRDFFSVGSFGDHFELRTEIFDQAQQMARAERGSRASVCFVGDTPDDIRAAHAIGARIVAVATGIYDVPVLARENPDACFKSCAEILVQRPSRSCSFRQ